MAHMQTANAHIQFDKTVGCVAFFDYAQLFLGTFDWVDSLYWPFTPHLIIVTDPTILSS